eukprot:m.129850 g.129850  ORF g.129850 m.129850 type:complete len:168 (-) comp15709_c1_seq1:1457-1960(-)
MDEHQALIVYYFKVNKRPPRFYDYVCALFLPPPPPQTPSASFLLVLAFILFFFLFPFFFFVFRLILFSFLIVPVGLKFCTKTKLSFITSFDYTDHVGCFGNTSNHNQPVDCMNNVEKPTKQKKKEQGNQREAVVQKKTDQMSALIRRLSLGDAVEVVEDNGTSCVSA